ncbi:class I tRNA ligase family protein [Bacillus sp. WP8]|uniref:class I tRNA ligase family protein n=1 Tax=Bacillus sp. WP8 TaxID=756828 RepID=UPI0037BF0F06
MVVSGYEIIFLWVCGMMLEGVELRGEKGFKDVVIHGVMGEEEGGKMRRWVGKGIGGMEVMEK